MKVNDLRKISLLFLLVLVCAFSFSQGKSDLNIFKLMERRDIRLSEIDALAKKHFNIVGRGKGTGNKQYERWKYEQQFHLNADGYILPADYDAGQFSRSTTLMPAAAETGAWKELGPAKWQRTTSWNPGVGRLTSIAVFPSNQNIIYVTSPGGGIWKTTTGGGNWTPLTDNNASMMNMSSVVVDPTNSDVVYAGNSTFYKSINGGGSWTSSSPGVSTILKILLNPNNSQVIWAVGNSGISQSIDGGSTWVKRSNLSTEDIEFKPGNTNVMYATGSSSSSAFHKSNDGGVTWTTVGSASGITNTGRSLVSVSPANADRVYVLQANGSEFGRMYRSDDGGNTFITTVIGNAASGTNYFGYENNGTGTGGQAWYDMAMTVNPANANEVHIGGIICWKSTNGGSSFVSETAWYLPNSIGYNHADVHVLEWVGTTIYSGSDGGIYKSTDYGDNWTDLSVGLGVRQFYRISNSKTNTTIVTGGAQDNGSSVLKSTGWIDWLGADGMDCAISPLDSNTIIGTSQYGSLYRTTNGGTSYSGISAPASGNWVTPLVMESNSNNLYVGWNGVYRSTDLGTTWTKISGTVISSNVSVLAISPSNPNYIYAAVGSTVYVTKNGGSSWVRYTAPSTVNSIAIHHSNPEKVWVASNSPNQVLVSTNACSTYTNIASNLPAIAARSIVVDNSADEGLYVGMNIGIYYTNKNSTTWTNLTDNLPQVAVNEVELQLSGGKLRVASYGRGVWERPMYSYCQTPSSPAGITTSVVSNECGARIYRYTAPALTGNAKGWQWSFVGTLGNNAVVDSGSLNSQVVRMKYSLNTAAATGDSVRLEYTSDCGNGQRLALKLTNTSLSLATAPSSITVTTVRNICGDRVYRYTAPALTGTATGWEWSFVGQLGANAVVDSGSLTSRIVRMRYTLNNAAATGDSARVAYTSNCGTSARRSLRLTNTLLSGPAAPSSITVTTVRNICGDRVYRYTAPALTGTANGWQWSFVGKLGANAVVDSGSLTSRIVRMKYTLNTAAATGDSVRVAYTSSCGTGLRRALKLTNTLLSTPSAPSSITVTSVRDTCGGRIYRYTAPALTGSATGWEWSFVGVLGTNAVIDSGTLTSRIVRMKYTLNTAAARGDSARVAYTSSCGTSPRRVLRLTNSLLSAPTVAPAAPTITLVSTTNCTRVYRYSTTSTLTGTATGYRWSFVGSLGATAVLDSGSLTSRVVRMSFTSTSAAANDSARVVFTSGCGNGPVARVKLSNTLLNCTPVKISGVTAANRTSANMVEIPFNVKVYPNPSMGVFNIEVQSPEKESVLIKVIDMQGRLVNSMKANPNTNIKIGWELRPGIYFLEVTQAGNKKYIKLLKD